MLKRPGHVRAGDVVVRQGVAEELEAFEALRCTATSLSSWHMKPVTMATFGFTARPMRLALVLEGRVVLVHPVLRLARDRRRRR